jgi:hypothetical protein
VAKDKNKDKKGYIAKEEYLAEPSPDGLDTNCDGKLTINESQDFDRKQSTCSKEAPTGSISPAGNAPA